MEQQKLYAGAGSSPICFSQEVFPADGITSVHDDPFFKVLVLECGKRTALCSAELVNLFDDSLLSVRNMVGKITGTPVEDVWVHVTHAITTPHAPRDMAQKAAYTRALMKAVEAASLQARDSFREVKLSLGTGESHVNINRDIETPFGWWTGHNPEGYSNKTVTVLKFTDTEGKTAAVLVAYGLKPCAIDNSEMEKQTRKVSSDLPGYAMRKLEEETGAPCLYFMTAAGDQVPREQAWYESYDEKGEVIKIDHGVEFGLEIVSRLGEEFLQDVKRVLENTVPQPVEPIKRGVTSVRAETKGRIPMKPRKEVSYEITGETDVPAELVTLGDIAFVGARPEINAITEKALTEGSPYKTTLLFSFVNGGQKYMPDAASYKNITWESQSAMLTEGTAEAFTEQVIRALKELKEGTDLPEVTAIAEPYPDGERVVKAVVAFSDDIPDITKIRVLDRRVTDRKVENNILTLTLSEEDPKAFVLPKANMGPGPKKPEGEKGPAGPGNDGPGKKFDARLLPSKERAPILLDVVIPGKALCARSGQVEEKIIDTFTQGSYKSMTYNLFTPEFTDDSKKYPLVLFIPDASANGSDPKVALSQGIGATVFADPLWQKDHPCYVLAVQVPKNIFLTNDDNEAAPEIEDIKELADKIIRENPIDEDRIYTTGQSQGCMASCELNLRYPDFFAASLLVSGQWDLERMSTLTDQKFFIGLSSGGMKEYPFMQAWTKNLKEQGVKVSEVHLNFRDGFIINDEKVRALPEDSRVIYAVFDKETAFPEGAEVNPGSHHGRGWELTYQLRSALEWIFRQKKK